MAGLTLPHVRITAEGTLGDGAGNEIWSCSFKAVLRATDGTGGPVAPVQSDLDQLATVAQIAWEAFVVSSSTSGQGRFSKWVNLVACKASAVIANGKNDATLRPALALASSSARGAANGTNNDTNGYLVPYQVSAVVTLKGDQYDRGSAGKGRIYLPCPNINNGGAMVDGLMGVGAATSLALGAKGLFDAFNGGGSPLSRDLTFFAANIGNSLDLAGLRWQPITKVTVDNRPDTIRTRYSALSGRGKVTEDLA